ncbi:MULTISPECIES: rod shape-determining protein RodA [Basfia]|uniref:Peptidoglycan glycosyltransferase MrdB n=2 Tax=Basfia TaxID=697331 RepID=Q65RH2_MANSM|nr:MULTISPECIES: rod shape-determining protein RodA [Basfia]AAU38438.1 FtsW protein [[Mannheimia] succiniciproducens MBEL55E]QIM69049.1 rod shape-determining protein RodA [Basfia succiniciproducens]SCY19711.1 cell elongation-specific peptidoglycan biosynthesis regulator RodA [Basfia succiniciproducens]SEQ44446.1 cell elongation-specific peptidoglycan biosynthesis regulator RodA [Basfia succiniciproducens]
MTEKKSIFSNIWTRLHLDFLLLVGLLVVSGYGLIVLYSASGGSETMFRSRIIQVVLGFAVMIVMAQFPPRFYQRIAPYLFFVGLIMLILVDLIGTTSKGAQRWLDLGLFRFQPSEIVKLSVPLMVAVYLGNKKLPPKLSETVIALAIIVVPTLLVAIQPDLGTSILVSASGLFVVFLAGMSWWLILAAVVGLAAFIPIMWLYLMHDYQRTRVLTLLDPEKDPLGAGYHILQSKIAIGSGGLWGKGWMLGTQSQLDFLPEPHTDFIFAVLSEEQGMFGITLLMLIYFFIIIRGLIIGVNAETAFGRILTGALTLIFFVYIFVNIGMVSGILPVVGVPLPLISYGGTSFVSLMAGFGVIMSIHTHKRTLYHKGN